VGLDESDSFTHWMLRAVNLFRRQYDQARLELEKAIEMNPNDSEARGIYGLFLSAVGKAELGIEQLILRSGTPVRLHLDALGQRYGVLQCTSL
jgi:Tfp pilus assembly protein PilF